MTEIDVNQYDNKRYDEICRNDVYNAFQLFLQHFSSDIFEYFEMTGNFDKLWGYDYWGNEV